MSPHPSARRSPALHSPARRSPAPRPGRARLWPLWGVAGGLLGEVATILTDVRSPRETAADEAGLPYTVTPDDMALLDGRMLYIGFVVGFASVAALLVFAAAWKRHVETRYVTSTAARLVSIGFVVSAAGLTLGYGWKGALGNYLTSEAGLFDERGLFVYTGSADC